jgi:NADPH2:quinone reductase
VDVVVDIIAGDYVARNYAAAAMNGRIVQIGVIKGPAQALDLVPMLAKRLTHIGSTLRSRTHEAKAELIEDLARAVWPQIRRGAVKPVIYRTFDLADARGAHALMDSGAHIGKIVLTTRAASTA